MSLIDQVAALCDQAVASLPEPLAGEASSLRQRLDGPLRVAVAGRVKAGKSTLLNALVGERLAPTDAGECTRIITWYEEGTGYDVEAELPDGSRRPVAFRRNGALRVELEDLRPEQVSNLRVSWPSRRLHDMTLIDTPGLASVHGENSARTEDFLTVHDDRAGSADAVVYLLRHVHRHDVEFLDAFMDRRVAHASPANAIAVLSRADEIGGGRLDALDSARRIAGRYRTDGTLRSLVDTIMPVAGLLAETGTTLREDEFAALRMIAVEPDAVLDALLVTADRFVEPTIGPLTVELRRDLLDRLGLFGVRFAVDCIRRGGATSAAELSTELVAASGLRDLEATIRDRFLPRARVLQARSVLAGLRSLARTARPQWPEPAAWLDNEVERVEAGAAEVAAVRLLHVVVSGQTRLADDEIAEVRRLVVEPDDRRRLGLVDESTDDEVHRTAGAAAGRWHARAGDPLADPTTVEACELTARLLEQIYARP
jgi:hypothetical protein